MGNYALVRIVRLTVETNILTSMCLPSLRHPNVLTLVSRLVSHCQYRIIANGPPIPSE